MVIGNEEEHTGEILPPESKLDVGGSSVPIGAIQELFNRFSSRPTKIIKSFSQPYAVSLENIESLNPIILAIFDDYKSIARNVNVFVN